RSADVPTTTGLLPPSSSVTGTRCSAAARNTDLATPGDPVKRRWAKGWAANAAAISAPPSTTAASVTSKYAPNILDSSAEVAGASSDGLSSRRLPAANTLAAARHDSSTGPFQGTIAPTTPSGS